MKSHYSLTGVCINEHLFTLWKKKKIKSSTTCDVWSTVPWSVFLSLPLSQHLSQPEGSPQIGHSYTPEEVGHG